jgi:hypothetical protein
MRIDQRIKELHEGLTYLGEYDSLIESPTKKKVISIRLSNRLLQKMGKIKNRSRFIESAIEKSLPTK